MKSFHERRRHPRLEHNVPLKISGLDFDVVTETRNLSSSGAYCRVDKYIEPMTKLSLQILVPLRGRNNKVVTKKIACQGVVVRVEPQANTAFYNVAIYFLDIPPRDAKNIKEYMEAMLASSSQ